MFEVQYQDGRARAGALAMRAGTVRTPFFMPVIMRATRTNFGPDDYYRLGADAASCEFAGTSAAICNSLIAAFMPGIDAIVESGGVHEFLEFNRPLFTDSGGYQVSRESSFTTRVENEGILFAARWCGTEILLTPQESMRIQQAIRSDVAMVLDDMVDPDAPRERQLLAIERTHRWAERCLLCHSDSDQLLFGICQGGIDEDLRAKSAAHIDGLGFSGVAMGGIALQSSEFRCKSVRAAVKHLDRHKPRYVMGVGHPTDILEMVGEGIDCFDAAFPTIQARRGMCLTYYGMVTTEQLRLALRTGRPVSDCDCAMCNLDDSGLFDMSERAEEAFGVVANHNLRFMEKFMRELRSAVENGSFNSYRDEFVARWTGNAGPAPTPAGIASTVDPRN